MGFSVVLHFWKPSINNTYQSVKLLYCYYATFMLLSVSCLILVSYNSVFTWVGWLIESTVNKKSFFCYKTVHHSLDTVIISVTAFFSEYFCSIYFMNIQMCNKFLCNKSNEFIICYILCNCLLQISMTERCQRGWAGGHTCPAPEFFDSLNDPASYQQGTYLQNFAPLFHINSYKMDSNIYLR